MRFPVMLLYTDEAANNEFISIDGSRALLWGTGSTRTNTIPVAASISNFKVDFQTAPGAGTSRTTFFFENAATNSLSIAIADANTSGTDGDTDPIAATGTLVLRQSLSGAAAAPGRQYIRFLYDSNEQPLCTNSGANMGTSTTTRYMPVQGAPTGIVGTAAAAQQVFPTAATIGKAYGEMNGTIASGSVTATLVKNGVDTALALVFDSSNQTRNDTSNTVSVSAGDLVYWRLDIVAPATSRTLMMTCSQSPTTYGEAVIMTGDSTSQTTTTVYNGFYGMSLWDTTEVNVQNMALGCTFKKMVAHLSVAPGSGKSRTLTFRVGGVDSALTTTISDAATTGSVTANVGVADGNLLSVGQTTSGSPASSVVKYGLVYHIPTTGYPKVIMF